MSKLELNDFVKYGRLFEIYGGLLSDDRQKIMTDYFEYNMTLVEIAKDRNISRQAVLDAIDKACQKLRAFENELHICKKKETLQNELQSLLKIAEENSLENIKEKVEKILRNL